MVFCTYCGQSFTRDEHLERHILTHTNIKPFKCLTCHMSFARRDLLQRHYTVHGRNANNEEGLQVQGMIPKSAGRTPIACTNCAKTKTKCDKQFPCSRCAQRNLKCQLRAGRRQSKGLHRAGETVEAGERSGSASDASATKSQNPSGNNSPTLEVQPHIPNAQASPQHAQLPQFSPSGQSQSRGQSQSPSITHSRNTSISQPVQAISNPTPEERPLQLPISQHTPPFFDQSAPNAILQGPSLMSPMSDPNNAMNGFVTSTPMSGYDDFVRTVQDQSDNGASPQFMMDPWSSMGMGNDFDPMRIDPSLLMHINMDMTMGPPQDGILDMMPEMSPTQAFGTAQTPLQPAPMDESFAELRIGSSAAMYQASQRHSSIADTGVPDIPATVAAQEGWTVFRCTPLVQSYTIPRTARINLEHLELSLRNSEGWKNWTPSWDDSDFQQPGQIAVAGITDYTRDKLLAIAQTFLHKALDIHKEGSLSSSNSGESPASFASGSNWIVLPPGRVLECFLQSYANSFERYYPTSAQGTLDANELMHNGNDKTSSLLLLMMIAQGAMNIPSMEARLLTGGFTEACRISLFDLIEKNIIMAGDPNVLRAALLFTVQAAWSGDKWQMDIAMGQRGMYFAMLRHSGILETRPPTSSSQINRNLPTEVLWQEWLQHESQSRLIYSWVMVDQDLALFHDTAPLFSVTEFGAPMPDTERLWQAQTAAEWSDTFNHVHAFSHGFSSVGSGVRPHSLSHLFRLFLDDEIVINDLQEVHLTPMHLRLLLHPLQTLVCQYGQLLSCFSDSVTSSRSRNRALTAASTRVRLEEVQALLGRWFDLAKRYMKASPMCAMMQANLVMFHLISINAVTNFPEIERFARREDMDGSYQQMQSTHKKCLSDVQEAIVHAGQVLRLVREMPRGIRPPWWAGAVYRAALVLWTDTQVHNESVSPRQGGLFTPPNATVAVDQLPSDHPLILRYQSRREGIPVVTKSDGNCVPIDNAFAVLSHCVDILDEGVSTRLTDGIRNKLEKLARA